MSAYSGFRGNLFGTRGKRYSSEGFGASGFFGSCCGSAAGGARGSAASVPRPWTWVLRAVLRCRVWRRIRPGGNNVLNSAAARTSGEQRCEDGHDNNAHHDGGLRDRVPPNEDE